MTFRSIRKGLIPLFLASLLCPPSAHASETGWVPLWTASAQPVWDNDTSFFQTGLPQQVAGTVAEQPLTLSLPSENIRIEFSNRYAGAPLGLADGQVRCLGHGGDDSAVPMTFAHAKTVSIPAGARAVSDPVAVAGCHRIAVRVRFTGADSGDFHWDGRETSHYVTADGKEGTMTARLALSAVYGDARARDVVVALGDSITDGNGAPIDAMARWPDYLSQQLAPHDIAVINAGISGNRLLAPGMGRPVVERIADDAFALPGADTVVLLIGTNDIAWPGTPFQPDEPPMTLAALLDGFRSIFAQAELHGTRLIVATIAPFGDALPGTPMEGNYWTPGKEDLRLAFNAWLRDNHGSAELFDLDRLLADPSDPAHLRPAYDSGDRLHPGATGNRAIADALVPLILSGERK
ncbi:GDSL-type esterase/lipase family protein [Novosphingobium beihaiensis]|uniref:GDSL-type esterase/lipase family protein n=1 Tax=Novosphingobium beihaiensis TaxID=2930389 RepID=A0ABT0BRW2_9SPHN|nr:GDSL-type esterase/lipase family protein [Novosphingobium beihaiensis]MCJ2187695.1 GDSL-type esterase/lipase family protein [Novosphingobium beihaiensis]